MRKIVVLVVLLCSLLLANISWAAPSQIAVAIELDKLAVQLRGQSDYQVLDTNNTLIYESKGKQNAFLNIKEGALYINNEKLPNKVRLVPLADNFIEINRRTYRGVFDVYKTKENTIDIINTLPTEDYITSALAKEIDLSFNEQVLKAQAVAMRSQAYFLLQVERDKPYDIIANDPVHGVVYLGKDAESPEARKAVQETSGEVLFYNNRPAYGIWHVSSGGYTESGKGFFNIEMPYLQSVKDFDEKSRFYSWKQDFAPADLDTIFERAGYRLGKIQLLKLSKLPKERPSTNPPADRSPTGRLKEITIVGEQGQVLMLSGQQFADIVGLNSNLFDITIGVPLPKDIVATVKDAMGNEHELDRIQVNLGEREGYRLPGDDENTRRISRVNNDKIVFYGYGTGRQGFGMSQQGAQAMATKDLQAMTEALKAAQAKQKAADKARPKATKPETDKAAEKKVEQPTAPKQQTADKPEQQAAPTKDNKANTATNKKEEVKLASDYYKKILHYYFTSVTIEKVY